ncbi:MAG: hypothetical protein ACI38Q_08810 [Candidatus Bruticola sp.]
MHNHYRRLGWPLLCLVLLFMLSSTAFSQQAQINPDVLVNGTPLARSAVIGSTGQDIAVKASPLLKATGASVEFDGQKLEASWSASMLTIIVGQPYCIYNGQQISMSPSGLYENDLVVQLNEICSIIKAQTTNSGQQILVKTDTGNGSGTTAISSVPLPSLNSRVSAKSAYLSSIQSGGNVFGMPPLESLPNTGSSSPTLSAPDAMDNKAFPEAGLGGLSSKNAKSSPYERPVVSVTNVGSRQITTEQPRTIDELSAMQSNTGLRYPSGLSQMYGMASGVNGATSAGVGNPGLQQQPQPAVISYSQAAPSASDNLPTENTSNRSTTNSTKVKPKPATPEIVEFDVLRQMSFFATAYEIKAVIRNTGELAVQKPFMVKFMVKSSKRGSHWEVVEDYLINPLAPGQQVEISKRVDGHQYACLLELSIDFKASVVEEVVIPLTDRNGRNWKRSSKHSSYAKKDKETANSAVPSVTRTKETCSREKNLHF